MSAQPRIDVMAQRADLTLPYPPSVNDLYTQSVTVSKKSTLKAFSRDVASYARGLCRWSDVRRHVRVTVFPGSKGKRYMEQVASAVALARARGDLQEQPLIGPMAVHVIAYPGIRKRVRDNHNLLKALFDAIEFARVVLNDSQFDDVRVTWGAPSREARVRVLIRRRGASEE